MKGRKEEHGRKDGRAREEGRTGEQDAVNLPGVHMANFKIPAVNGVKMELFEGTFVLADHFPGSLRASSVGHVRTGRAGSVRNSSTVQQEKVRNIGPVRKGSVRNNRTKYFVSRNIPA